MQAGELLRDRINDAVDEDQSSPTQLLQLVAEHTDEESLALLVETLSDPSTISLQPSVYFDVLCSNMARTNSASSGKCVATVADHLLLPESDSALDSTARNDLIRVM